ncbi:MAG: Major Facilitator Superfamily protein [Syntrophorhabdus sp. PtaU1.Bin058]|nr:MAG: Major Facilitator Superfamily protein [Syntrophorhabdus sp. PtaU1.Bin058]
MTGKEVYSGYRWVILALGCFVLISYSIDLIIFAPMFPEIARDLNVNIGDAFYLAMASIVTLAAAMVFGGFLVDRFGITFVFVLGLLCASVPAVLMPWLGQSYRLVFVARLLQGCVAVTFATIGPILALWFPKREQGLAGGIFLCSLSLGNAIGMIIAPVFLQTLLSWQKIVALSSLPGWACIALVCMFGTRKPAGEAVHAGMLAEDPGRPGMTYARALHYPMTWIGTGVLFFNCWGLYTLANIIPSYLSSPVPAGVGLELVTAGKLALLMTIMGIPAFVVGGIFFDKAAKGNTRPAVFIGFAVTGTFTYLLLLPPVYQYTPFLIICLIMAGLGVSFMGPSVSAFVAVNYHPELVGSMMGWWFGFGTLGGAMGTLFAGFTTAASGNFYWTLAAVSFASAAGFLLTFFLKQSRDAAGPEKVGRTATEESFER